MSDSGAGIRKWIDAHLVEVGFVFLFLGALLTILESFRAAVPIDAYYLGADGATVSVPGLTIYVLSQLAAPLVYNSVLLISVGLLLRNWRVAIVGFENAHSAELVPGITSH